MDLNRAELAAVNGVTADLLDAQGRLVITPNAVTLDGQRNVPADLRPGENLADFLGRHVPGIESGAWTVMISGAKVPQRMWAKTFPKHGMLIACRASVGKQVIAIIAVAILAYFTMGAGATLGGSLLGVNGLAAVGAAGAAALNAGIFMVGSMLINKVLAPKVPKMEGPAAARTVYSLSNQRNRARPFEPLPTLWGEMRVTPDLASAPYTWFEGDDQYLSTILLGGINVNSAADLSVGDTPITNYNDVSLFHNGFPGMPSVDVPLYSNADTVSGAELENDGDWVVRTSSTGTTELQFDFEGQLYDLSGTGKTLTNSVPLFIETRPVGTTVWMPALTETLTNATTDVLRRTFAVSVALGQHEARVRLGAPTWDDGEGKDACKIGWNVLRSIQPDTTDYSAWGRIGIKIKATGQLSGSLDTLRVTYRARPMPLWNGTEWVTATTRETGLSNPGAILLQTLRGVYAGGVLQFGFGMQDAQIDIEGLKAFMLHCTARGYTYDKWITSEVSLGQFCQEVALAGMGEFSWTDGSRPTAVFVSDGQPLSGVVNMANMLKASFEVSYNLSNAADGIEYQFLDRQRNWETTTLRVTAPGVTTMLNPARITGEGVTNEAHAAVMARYHLAQSLYQYKTVGYTADIEHLDYRRLSVLSVSHDLTQWGFGGRLVSAQIVGGRVQIDVGEDLPALPTPHVGLRLPGQRDYRVWPVDALAVPGRILTLQGTWPAGLPLPGATSDDPAHDTLWCYDFKATPGYRVRVVSMEPESDLKGAKVSCVPEGPEFWNYVLNGTYEPAGNASSLVTAPPIASNLRITRSRVKVGNGWEHELSAVWDVSGNYDHAQVWAAPAGQPLVLVDSNVYGTRLAWRVPSDQTWSVEVRPFDGLGRMGVIASQIFTDPSVIVGAVVGLAASVETNGIVLRWSTPQDIESIGYASTQIRMGMAGATWETASRVFEGNANTCNLGWLQSGTLVFYAVHLNTAGDTSTPVSTSLVIAPPIQPIVTGEAWIDQVELQWPHSPGTQPLRGYEVRVGDIYLDAPVRTVVDALGYVYTTDVPGTYMHWVTGIDVAGNRSAPGYVSLTTLPHISEAVEQLAEGLDDVTAGIISIDAQIATINSQLADLSGVPDWDSVTTYAANELVKFDGGLYRSLQNSNTNKSPATSPTWWTKIGDYASIGEAVGALAAQVSYHDTQITGLGSTVTAQASSISSLTAQVGANTASVSTVSTAVATLTGRVNASYTLSVTAGSHVAGFRVATDGATSDFVILSNRFAWAMPDGSGVKYPLVLGSIAGVASFGFSGNMFVDGMLQARMIGADQVRAVHIRTDEIEARHVKAGTLTADKAAFGVSGNMLANSVFLTTSSWDTYDGIGGCTFGRDNFGVDRIPRGGHTLTIYQPSGGGVGAALWISEMFPATPLLRHEFSVDSGAYLASVDAYIEFHDISGNWAGGSPQTPDSTNNLEAAGGPSLGNFKRIFGFGVAPANTATCRLVLRKQPTSSGFSDSLAIFSRPFVGAANPYQTQPTPYQPSGLGVRITPEGINTPSLGAISDDLGIVIHGKLVSEDGMMTVDMDDKSVYMLKAGRRVEITPGGFYFGADNGVGNRLSYSLDSGALTLNGAFTADALNVVQTANIAGQAVTTLEPHETPGFLGFFGNGTWEPALYFGATVPSGASGVMPFLTASAAWTINAALGPPIVRIRNTTTGQIVFEEAVMTPTFDPVVDTAALMVFASDKTPAAGGNTYVVEAKRSGGFSLKARIDMFVARR